MGFTQEAIMEAINQKITEKKGFQDNGDGTFSFEDDNPFNYDKKDPDYSMDNTPPPKPDPKKTPVWVIKKKVERYSAMFVAMAFKVEAAIIKFTQRKENQPVVTITEHIEIERNAVNYNYEYEKENFMYGTGNSRYHSRKYRDSLTDQLDGCCVCFKIDKAKEDQVQQTTQTLRNMLNTNEGQWRQVRLYAWKNNLDVKFPIEADEIRKKLQDPELSKRDLDAILDAILKDEKDGVSDKGKGKGKNHACGGGSGMSGKSSSNQGTNDGYGKTTGKAGAKPKGKTVRKS